MIWSLDWLGSISIWIEVKFTICSVWWKRNHQTCWSMSNSQLTPICQQKRWNRITCNLHTIITGCKYFHTLCVRTKYVNHPILICWRIPSKKQQLRSFLLSKLGGLSPVTFLFCEILIEQTWNLSFCSCFSLWECCRIRLQLAVT